MPQAHTLLQVACNIGLPRLLAPHIGLTPFLRGRF
nr:MAG TPA: hypothetical protein [Caudoviricetes sp.]